MTLTFADQVDASRGDMVVGIDGAPASRPHCRARVLDEQRTAAARTELSFQARDHHRDGDDRSGREHHRSRYAASGRPDAIAQNEIGFCTLKLARPIAVERYADCKETGSFILIDPESYDTVGMGCVETVFALPRPAIVAATAPLTPSRADAREAARL